MTIRFDHQTDHSHNHRGDNQHCEKDIHAKINGSDSGVSAHNHELSVGKIYDLHHAENHGEASADKRQKGDRVENFNQYDESQIHLVSQSSPCEHLRVATARSNGGAASTLPPKSRSEFRETQISISY